MGSMKNRIIFDGLSWPAKIGKLSAAMTWPPKINLFSVVIFIETAKNYIATKISTVLFSAACM
jgi:hypothetical protein